MNNQMVKKYVTVKVHGITFDVLAVLDPGSIRDWSDEAIYLVGGETDISEVLTQVTRNKIVEEVDRELQYNYPEAYR